MNYAAQTRKPNAGALLGALAIPAGVGAALIVGLAVTHVVTQPDAPLQGFNVKPTPIDPPPPEPEVEQTQTNTPQTARPAPDPVVPDAPFVIASSSPEISTAPVGTLTGPLFEMPLPGGEITGPPIAPALPELIAVTPRGDPSEWIMERDYRSRWIREGLSGVAGFTLQIDARGRVSDCAITRSTGHDALDGATCRLLTRRAKFNPARNAAGDKVAGTYSSSVDWNIP
ncbi:MAG: TonB family protein [Pseudomonadota bacterium]